MALLPVCAVDSLKCKVVEARKIGISQSFSVWHQASYSALVVNDVSMNGGGAPSSLSMNGGGAPSSLSAAAFSPLSAAAFFGAAFFLLSAAFSSLRSQH